MRVLLWILGAPSLANGLWMLFGPAGWYEGLPAGVPDTGPLNAHFVRDIGSAYITFGAALCVAAELPRYRQGAVLAAAGFFGLHAAVHVADLIAGRLDPDHWLIDAPGVFLPALILIVLCMPRWWTEQGRTS